MIDYFKGIYGANLLLRVHGSALYKGCLIGIISILVFLFISLQWNENRRDDGEDLDHPYGVGVLVSSVSFLIIFRANYGYQRYWEACSAVNHFMSKWMDATIHCSVFHMQNKHYDSMRPPSFFSNNDLNKLNLTRERHRHSTAGAVQQRKLKSVLNVKKIREPADSNAGYTPPGLPNRLTHADKMFSHWRLFEDDESFSPAMLEKTDRVTQYFPSYQEYNQNFAHRPEGQTPPLFLQELAHLSSLLCAVALSTLRNDLEERESPVDVYNPGSPWPVADPAMLPKDTRREFNQSSPIIRTLRFWAGMDRTPRARAKYNAARPMLVIGGVSDNEIAYLQKARGPSAKTQLAWGWLSEFIVREHLSGSLGDVHSAIISRLVQFLSDGMVFYNHARKVMYIPFPFPHAQLCVFFTATMVPTVPFLMDQYTNSLWLGSAITFLTVACLVGLHEVARELENPFRNVPNELPLVTIHAMYNEALLTIFSGYNPDSFWDASLYQGELHMMEAKKNDYTVNGTLRPAKGAALKSAPEESASAAGSGKIGERKMAPEKSASIPGGTSAAAKELLDILAKQAKEIETLSRLMDEN